MASIWQIAKEMETEGRKFYESLAQDSPRGLAGAFQVLAKEEQRHYDIFDRLEKNAPPDPAAKPIVVDIRQLYRTIREEFQSQSGALAHLDNAEIGYRQALVLEKKSIEQYQKIISDLSDESQKSIVNRIIDEENRHVKIIEGLIDFVRRPKEWLENAEFFKQADY